MGKEEQTVEGGPPGCLTENANNPVNPNNQVTTFCYDGAGNLLDLGACGPLVHSFVYDAEGHLQSPPAVGSGNSAFTYTYFYDGDGDRVQKCNANPCTSSGTAGTLYWRGVGGEVLDESSRSGSGAMQEEYVYFNGQRIARRDVGTGNVHYYFSDHLGSASVIADGSNGNVQEQMDFYPFGGISYSSGADSNRYKFTGKERDTESNLDEFGARYYGSSLGRFMTPDPILANELRTINSQRWNQYSYAVNNPLAFTDPDGKDAAYVNFSGMAHGYGHAGVLSIHSNGSATYSRFGPASAGSPVGKGEVQTDHELPSVKFGADLLPTPASYAALAVAVAQYENVDPSTVGIAYFKTPEAETQMLDQYILKKQAASDAGQISTYCVKGNNCADYAIQGLVVGGALENWRVGFLPPTPNGIFSILSRLADGSVGTSEKKKEKVTHKICYTDDKGKRRCTQ